MYKWGLINKKAGDVTLTTTIPEGSKTFQALLTAKSASWADRIFSLRDTLSGSIDRGNLLPQHYEKIAHEGGDFDHDILTYTRASNTTIGHSQVWRKKKKNDDTTYLEKTHVAIGPTFDMLSSYYYMRALPFATMKKNQGVKVTILSGKRMETLTIRYVGQQKVKVNGKEYPSYHVKFTFTSGDGKKSSDDMDAWISTSSQRIPLLLEGKLPVGKVRCEYRGTVPAE